MQWLKTDYGNIYITSYLCNDKLPLLEYFSKGVVVVKNQKKQQKKPSQN